MKFPFEIHPVDDRDYWGNVRTAPRHAAFWAQIETLSARVPQHPTPPLASDYLAARRHNDRGVIDRYWGSSRSQVAVLALRRCALGLDEEAPDDRLLNHLWASLTRATWAASAHLPGHDLPLRTQHELDLCTCEMAAQVAEIGETLRPWMNTFSATLADNIIAEIDARVLEPYGEGLPVWWQDDLKRANNWMGVCAGSILVACQSLAAQGQPRPRARARALEGLRLFFEHAFTPGGECDEGMGYWNYGFSVAMLGLSRLEREELDENFDLERLRLLADYPRRTHLWEQVHLSTNDSAWQFQLSPLLAHQLGTLTANQWLLARSLSDGTPAPNQGKILFGDLLRVLQLPTDPLPISAHSSATSPASERVQWFPDQQTAVFRCSTPRGEMLATLGGGDNAERHNHNDLGHFNIAFDQKWIVPDMGVAAYATDFFYGARYNYLHASSRGHCCPLVNGFEQRAGHAAAAQILRWNPDVEAPELKLELSAAYPPEAGLSSWTRALRSYSEAQKVELSDVFTLQTDDSEVIHVFWSLETPQNVETKNGVLRFELGPLHCEIAPAPLDFSITTHSPETLQLREFGGQTLHCLNFQFRAPMNAALQITTIFTPRDKTCSV